MSYLLVNFGGPRELREIPEFLRELLTDRDVIRTRFPSFLHNWLFGRIARKRAKTIQKDYEEIGGCSPIYFDTEEIAKQLEKKLQKKVYNFHRYLPGTHADSIASLHNETKLTVLPLFPQFCYATTGSIARFLNPHLPGQLQWIKSYAKNPYFIQSYQRKIHDFLHEQNLQEEDCFLLFSAHGIPQRFVDEGDPYQEECLTSFKEITKGFPQAKAKLSYQSKFGRGEWLKPYTNTTCEEVLSWHEGRENIVVIPMSFTTDHIETLFEIEKLYLPIIKKQNLKAFRCPALNLEPYWIEALSHILSTETLYPTPHLIRGEGHHPKKSRRT